jgi:hypothetical protein
MAPPKLAATTVATYKEKELSTSIGGHKFNGAHQRSIEYLRGMDTFLSKARLLPFAVGTVSIVIRDFTSVRIYNDERTTHNGTMDANTAPNGNPFQDPLTPSGQAPQAASSDPLSVDDLEVEFNAHAWAAADENQYSHLPVDDDPFDGTSTSPPPAPTTGNAPTSTADSQLQSLFSDENEGLRYLHLHRESQRNGHGLKHPFLRLRKPVPSELLPFMYTDVPGLPGVVQLNVHIVVTGQEDCFGNRCDGNVNAYFHHVTADVFTSNIVTLYDIVVASLAGSAHSWARNPLVCPQDRGDILWRKLLQKYKPRTIFRPAARSSRQSATD